MARTRSEKSQSPYQRYGKSPYRYSELHGRWRAAILRGDKAAAERLSREHYDRFCRFATATPSPATAA